MQVLREGSNFGWPMTYWDPMKKARMLGPEYEGYFPHGDAKALAHLLKVCRATQGSEDPSAALLARLRAQCERRAPLFAPETERQAVLGLVQHLEEPA